jgi:AraC-like DNA-binding protein
MLIKNKSLKLNIKYMVSLRCKLVVKDLLSSLGILYSAINLGSVELDEPVSNEQIELLRISLPEYGLELIDSKKAILIQEIKNIIIEIIHYDKEPLYLKYSAFLSNRLNHNYTYLANIFSESEGITIEQFIILNKIEKVKELICYDELSLTEIAYKLNYSSVAHLSYQFKKTTGLTPSCYKSMKHKNRTQLEDL